MPIKKVDKCKGCGRKAYINQTGLCKKCRNKGEKVQR